MEKFRQSPTKRELLSFIQALGKSCSDPSFRYEPATALTGLSKGLASLHGSLRAIAGNWLLEIPPDPFAKARFGNPSFRSWHERLTDRSRAIVDCILDCEGIREDGSKEEEEGEATAETLRECSEMGYRAAWKPLPCPGRGDEAATQRDSVAVEMCAYLRSSFGHPARLDYGTGHESSFVIFLYALFQTGCSPKTKTHMAAAALSVLSAYLEITRGLQSEYMLEPAGSHGVWGLDDYHCLPFYFGACQLIPTDFKPDAIHNEKALASHPEFLYFGCIKFIKQLKKGVPFFESSPMLNDISGLPNWLKVSNGLLRLYEGEVLDKLPVVQHFVFGNIFKATWTPSPNPRATNQQPPMIHFINGPGGEECIAPWSATPEWNRSSSAAPVLPDATTRAPWAKK